MEKKYRRLWFRSGAIGCTLIGAGLSVTLDALALRMDGAAWWAWGAEGTAGLIVFMAGLAFLAMPCGTGCTWTGKAERLVFEQRIDGRRQSVILFSHHIPRVVGSQGQSHPTV